MPHSPMVQLLENAMHDLRAAAPPSRLCSCAEDHAENSSSGNSQPTVGKAAGWSFWSCALERCWQLQSRFATIHDHKILTEDRCIA